MTATDNKEGKQVFLIDQWEINALTAAESVHETHPRGVRLGQTEASEDARGHAQRDN